MNRTPCHSQCEELKKSKDQIRRRNMQIKDLKKKGDQFYSGFAIALSTSMSIVKDPSMIEMIMKETGITIADLKKAGVEKFDLDRIQDR